MPSVDAFRAIKPQNKNRKHRDGAVCAPNWAHRRLVSGPLSGQPEHGIHHSTTLPTQPPPVLPSVANTTTPPHYPPPKPPATANLKTDHIRCFILSPL